MVQAAGNVGHPASNFLIRRLTAKPLYGLAKNRKPNLSPEIGKKWLIVEHIILGNKETHIILFDGICNLCNGTIQFLIKRDSKGKFKFGSLQSEKGQALLKNFDLSTNDFDTFVYIKEDNFFVKTSAALEVLKELGGIWKFFYAFILIPKKARDFLYNIVVGNRYKWFGKRESCMVPTPELENRFL